jgi:sterol desaturase/sphingolipid hydroxylase (fatty acid hydroxylase superfamily)
MRTRTRLATTLARHPLAVRTLGATSVLGTVLVDRSGLGLAVALFVFVVPFETLFPRHSSQRVRRPGLGTDLAFALSTPLLSTVSILSALIIGALSFAWLPGLLFRPLITALPAVLVPVIGAALFDLVGYWSHRLAHEIPVLWRFHRVHHSAEHLDWLSGIRLHPLDGVLLGPPALFLIAAGFPAKTTGVLAVGQTLIGLFLHANVRWRWRPLHRIVATPDFHHWHHANEPDAIHTNYAAFFPIWDLLFGTYRIPVDRQPVRYGVDGPVPSTFVGLLCQPLIGLRRKRIGRPLWGRLGR